MRHGEIGLRMRNISDRCYLEETKWLRKLNMKIFLKVSMEKRFSYTINYTDKLLL